MDVDVETDLEVVEREEEEGTDQAAKPFILGTDELPEGCVLEPDESTYIMRHELQLPGSCFSFDILRDDLGDERQRLPTSAYIVAGSQAELSGHSKIFIAKLSSLHRTQIEDSDEEDEEDYEALDEDPIIEQHSISHIGAVNRVRAQRLATPTLPPVSQPYYAASFSDTGKVHIYNVRPLIESLDVPGYDPGRYNQNAVFTIDSHKTEGYAMDWNAPSSSSLCLLTGDNDSKIYLTTGANADFRPSLAPFCSHESSVEDIQWSPSEITVFASCSTDRSIRIWDLRHRARQSVASISGAHSSDINVISWNRLTSYLLLSGGDHGEIKAWDLRNIRETQYVHTSSLGTIPLQNYPSSRAQVARFDWHKSHITAIEWNPNDDSAFAASGDDHRITLWDLAVEQDEDLVASDDLSGYPPQLLFDHHQEQVKEMHWHPQIPGVIISAGVSALNVFKTISI